MRGGQNIRVVNKNYSLKNNNNNTTKKQHFVAQNSIFRPQIAFFGQNGGNFLTIHRNWLPIAVLYSR
jgi:hypothetical protein